MLSQETILKQFEYKKIIDATGKKNVSLLIVMPTRLVIVGSPTHLTLISLSKNTIENLINQKPKLTSWKWQILPVLKLIGDNFDYSILNEFALIDFFPNLNINHPTITLEHIIFRTYGISLYRGYDKQLMKHVTVVYPDIDVYYPDKEALLKNMVE